MQIELIQSNLSSTLKKATRFLSTKPQLPILSCFYLEALDQEIWLTATDLQMGMRQKVSGKVLEPGSCVIPAKVMNELVSSLSGTVELSLHELALTVKTSSIKSVVNTFPVQDFPPFPKTEGTAVELPLEFFNQSVDFVTFASGRDETRPILTSVLFELSDHTKAVSTDGFRLAVLETKIDVKEPQTLLFPAKAIDEITKVIQSESVKTVQLSLSQGARQVFFTLPNSQIVLRTLEGDFPNYQKIIPASFAIEVKADADELQHHIKSAMIFSNEGSSIVQLEIRPDQIGVSAKSSLLGEYESSLKASSNTEEMLKIAFNGRYLLDFLQRIQGKECVLRCNDPLKAAQLSCVEVPGFFYIVMPFRLNG